MTRCALCGQAINPLDPSTFQRVHAWERKGTGANRKSGSDIVLRERQQSFAHGFCVERKKYGISPNQDRMIV